MKLKLFLIYLPTNKFFKLNPLYNSTKTQILIRRPHQQNTSFVIFFQNRYKSHFKYKTHWLRNKNSLVRFEKKMMVWVTMTTSLYVLIYLMTNLLVKVREPLTLWLTLGKYNCHVNQCWTPVQYMNQPKRALTLKCSNVNICCFGALVKIANAVLLEKTVSYQHSVCVHTKHTQ